MVDMTSAGATRREGKFEELRNYGCGFKFFIIKPTTRRLSIEGFNDLDDEDASAIAAHRSAAACKYL